MKRECFAPSQVPAPGTHARNFPGPLILQKATCVMVVPTNLLCDLGKALSSSEPNYFHLQVESA